MVNWRAEIWRAPHFRYWGLVGTLLCALLWIAWALQASADAGYEIVSPPAVRPGDALPVPTGPVVLTVRGATRGNPVRFDRAGLERLGLIRYASKNRWYDRRTTYEGVLGSALLDAVGVPPRAGVLRMTALNDYVVFVPIADLRRWPVMLALKLDGEYMSVRDKGPIWLVYPNHLQPELGGPRYQGRWIWQLREIGFE